MCVLDLFDQTELYFCAPISFYSLMLMRTLTYKPTNGLNKEGCNLTRMQPSV